MSGISDVYVNDILRSMGVDVDKKKPPYWVQCYHKSKSIFGGKYEDGYMCSRCGKKVYAKEDVCPACNCTMTNVKE